MHNPAAACAVFNDLVINFYNSVPLDAKWNLKKIYRAILYNASLPRTFLYFVLRKNKKILACRVN